MNDLISGLNEKQKEVVLSGEGPILVLAGAGSGKTKALTHRVAYLIAERRVSPQNILAITFTNKAAGEMKERVQKLIGQSNIEQSAITNRQSSIPTMGTFHSVCARILRKNGYHLGISPGFVIYDEGDSLAVIKKVLKELGFENKKIAPQGVKSYISNAKSELISSEEYISLAQGYFQSVVAQVYPKYQKELEKNNALDFDDLLSDVVKLFQKAPEVLVRYQNLWTHILVDEYQDTNHAQYMFAKLLAEKHRNICVVGDDWQSIYSWRGANFQNILDFEKDYPEAKVIKLEQNYRSTKAILAAAQSVIDKNINRSKKVLWTENSGGAPIYAYEARNEEDEAGFICREIERLSVKNLKLSDVGIFYRTNAQSRALEEGLLRFQIPYKIVGGVRFYERKEIKDILAWLRLASGASDWISFERAVSSPPSGLGTRSIEKAKSFADGQNLTIYDLRDAPELSEILGEKYLLLKKFLKEIERVSERSKISLREGINAAIELSGYKTFLSDGSIQNEERLENLKELLSVAEEYEKLKGKMTLSDFLEEVALIADIDNYQEKAEGVTLMTLHTSKGLEFKTVFICGLEENIFPHSRSLFEPAELEEERRLFYVGLTRARENLYLVYAQHRLYFGGIQNNPPSRFIAEIPEHLIMPADGFGGEEKAVEITEERIPGQIKPGDKVNHENFGVGKVIGINDDELTVKFPEGEKIISIYYAPIKKV